MSLVNNASRLILFELSLCFKRVVAEKQEKRNQERLKRREEREREEREKLRRYGVITGVAQGSKKDVMAHKILDISKSGLGTFLFTLKNITIWNSVYSSILTKDCLSPGNFLQNIWKRESRAPHIFMFSKIYNKAHF